MMKILASHFLERRDFNNVYKAAYIHILVHLLHCDLISLQRQPVDEYIELLIKGNGIDWAEI